VGGRIALTQAAQHNRTTAHHMGSPQSTTAPDHAGYAIYDSSGRKRSVKDTQKPASSTTGRASTGFTDDERAAMKERARELKASARRGSRAGKADGESEVLAKIAEMPEADRAMAGRLHALIKASAPALSPRTWYGMPAYAKDGNVVCFFQSGQKFKTRYATFGFSDKANLDDGAMWPTAFALTKLTAAEEARIGALVKKAVS
jgi:uncharacterized protein YdhG (YjbR/CyaY superfamily)